MTQAIVDGTAEEQMAWIDETWADDPIRWAEDCLGISLWSKQREILDSVFHNRKTVVRSCHSSGKTFVAAVAVLAFLNLKAPSKIITTAPTWYQVKDLLWSEINYMFKNYGLETCLGDILTTKLNIDDNWFATGISPKDSINFQGYHQKHVLVIFDEAPGVRADVVEGAESLEASGDFHLLKIGNPVESSGHFYEDFRDPSTNKIHIPYDETPNFTDEEVPDEVKLQLVSKEWVEEKREKWGEDSPMFISRVKGDFPPEGERQVIPLGLCQSAVSREVLPEGDMELGVDVARYGTDLTVYTKKRGNVITDILTDAKRDTMEVTGRITAMHHVDKYRLIKVDVIGIGSGVVDRLSELGLPVVGVNSAEKAIEDDKYINKRTEMWFNMRAWLEYGRIPGNDDLIADLTAPQYKYISDGRYQMEKKEETKKRLKRSPDYGDSAVIVIDNSVARQGPGIY